jgi:hypothetical protein
MVWSGRSLVLCERALAQCVVQHERHRSARRPVSRVRISLSKYEIQERGEDETHDDRRCDGSVKAEAFAFDDDVTGQPAEPEFFCENERAADDEQDGAEEQKRAADLTHLPGLPRRSLPGSTKGLLFVVRVGFASVVLITVACAGRSISGDDGAGSGDDTGGSAGTTGGLGGTVTNGGRGGKATTGGAVAPGGVTASGGTSTGGSGGTAGICTLSLDIGTCEAAIHAYAYDVETGLCLPFYYGGCDGNPNRFETAEECYAACDGARVDGPAYCENSAECERVSTACCGCASTSFQAVVGVQREHVGVIQATKCATIDCDACAVDPAFAWFGASCRANHCVAWDAREEDLTLCMTDADCHLRNGFGCCEACEAGLQPVAVNSSFVQRWVCPDGQPPCPSCPNGGPVYPENAFAVCVNSRCWVALDDP